LISILSFCIFICYYCYPISAIHAAYHTTSASNEITTMATTPESAGSSQQKGKQVPALPDSYESFRKRTGSAERSPHQLAAPEPITTTTKMIFHHPMPVPGGYGSPFFDGKEITAFLKSLNRCFKDHEIDDDTEKKERTAEYSSRRYQREIERLLEYRNPDTTWEDFQKILLREYRYSDSDQLLHTTGYLEKYVKDFKALVDSGYVSQGQIYDYCRNFYEVGIKCRDNSNITEKGLIFKFLYALPQNLKIKAMKFATKSKKFDPDNMKSFEEIYKDVENSCVVLRDMDDLVREQGMGELPTGFENLDPDLIGDRSLLSTKTMNYDEKPSKQPRREAKPILPFIRAATTTETSKRMTSRDIDEITEGLDRLHILQAVVERATQTSRLAEVNTGIGIPEGNEDETLFEVNYGSFPARKRDYGNDETCKWCRNIQNDGMRPQAPHKYMNQCHDYKMFIGKGVIHESDDGNYICIGPWHPDKPSLPVQFSRDTPRRDQIISRVINTKYSHIPERREQALREEAESRLIAQKSRNESTVGNMEVFQDDSYDISDLLNETDLTDEKHAWVQGMIAREAEIEPVQTRASKRAERRDAPYSRDQTLQERLQQQASYGKTKAPQTKSVRFQSAQSDTEEAKLRATKTTEPKPETITEGQKVTKILKRPRQTRAETLSKLGYSYEGSLSKLLDQTTILPGFTLGEMISLADPAFARRLPHSTGQTDKRMQEMEILESEVGLGEFIAEETCQFESERSADVNPLAIENFSGYSDYHSPTPKVIITLTGRGKLADVRATLDTGAEVSVITLDAALRFEIPITHSSGMALRTIIGNKSRFVGFADNVAVTVGNTVVRTRFYIMDCPGIKVILGFPFIRKARVTFRYPRDEEDGPVFALLCDPRTGDITSVKTNTETEKARETYLYKAQNQTGIIESSSDDGYTTDSENA
jgi:hypothetical protein